MIGASLVLGLVAARRRMLPFLAFSGFLSVIVYLEYGNRSYTSLRHLLFDMTAWSGKLKATPWV